MVRRIGFPLSAQLVARELRIVQGTLAGCLFAMEHGVAFNVAGGTHHAGYDWGEGFCLLNDQGVAAAWLITREASRSEEHTSELQSLMRISYAVFCLKKKNK